MFFKLNTTLSIVILICGIALSGRAQTTAFSYQGRLVEMGNPVTGNRLFRFTLYDQNGAAIAGATVEQTLTVTDGVFATSLDFGSAAFPGATRTLETAVKINAGDAYTVLSPRQAILTTPYAIKSKEAMNAAQLGGVDAARFVQSDAGGSVAITGGLTVAGTFSLDTVNAQTQYNLGGQRVLAANNGLSNLVLGHTAGNPGTGQRNTFVGSFAGTVNTGNFNSFFGTQSGNFNTTGSFNSFFGVQSGISNTTGGNNSFFGITAGGNNSTGMRNTIVGANAGRGAINCFGYPCPDPLTGSDNSFFGEQAGRSNTTGFENSFFGQGAGQQNTEGRLNTFFGTRAGIANTIGRTNAFFGWNSGGSNVDGSFNAFFGTFAGNGNTSGTDNAIFGDGAGSANSTGGGNSIFGSDAGRGCNLGYKVACTTPTTGSDNSFFGHNAGRSNVTGGNSFFGASAGLANTSGNGNAFFGFSTGLSNTIGANNTFIGETAGVSNVAGNANTFVGKNAGSNNTASDNSFFGRAAGGNNTTGTNNSSFGLNAGLGNTTGSDNTVIGARSNVGANNLINATVIGANALVSQSNALILGNNANVGIGTSTPASKLTVVGLIETTTGGVKFPDGTIQTTAGGGGGGNSILNQTTQQAGANFNIGGTGTANIFSAVTQYNIGSSKVLSAPGNSSLWIGKGAGSTPPIPGNSDDDNTFVGSFTGANNAGCCNAFFGSSSGSANTTGSSNTFLGYLVGASNTEGNNNTFIGAGNNLNNTGFNNTFIGRSAGVSNTAGNNNTALGTGANVGANNLTFATAIGANAVVSASNTIVLGRTSDTVNIPGNLVVTGVFSNPSDARLKTGIVNLRYGLSEVMRLRPVTWAWKNDSINSTRLGLIAQEVQPVLPELIVQGTDKDRLLSMNYLGLIPVLVKGIQEQQQQIEQQRKQIESLTKIVCAINSKADICRQ